MKRLEGLSPGLGNDSVLHYVSLYILWTNFVRLNPKCLSVECKTCLVQFMPWDPDSFPVTVFIALLNIF